ncbi:hypothetical protein MASR2M66_12780 [Chloroflexota bacterium]
MTNKSTPPTILWDSGTAYEFFISLHVMLAPGAFGVRPSYAASIRARIPAAERKLLDDVYLILGVPFKWLHNLPAPKDASSALRTLKQIPPAERIMALYQINDSHESKSQKETTIRKAYQPTLTRVAKDGKWTAADVDSIYKLFSKKNSSIKRPMIESMLDWWSRPAELGEAYLSACQSYYQEFFEEEEKRIEPVLRAGLEQAQALAATVSFEELFTELSQGLQLTEEFTAEKFIFVPAFWTTPLVFFEKYNDKTMLFTFGARPADMSVVPGEIVPEALVRALKALADPTRLNILHYLSHENLSPSEIARKLQLRPPTVTHHLKELRLAGLVELSLAPEENRYTARKQTLDAVYANLQTFLKVQHTKKNV